MPSSYAPSQRKSVFGTQSETRLSTKTEEVTRLERRIKLLEDNVEELNVIRESLEDEKTRLQSQLREKETIIKRKDDVLATVRHTHTSLITITFFVVI